MNRIFFASTALVALQVIYLEGRIFIEKHTKHMKWYATEEEEEKRKQVFMNNLKFIREHNKKYDNQKETFTVAVNQFTDMTNEEFRQTMNRYTSGLRRRSGDVYKRPENLSVPVSADWRDEGAVTPVKNQGSCGSCWSFSATGSIEGQHFLKTGELVSLSEQNLVDCSESYGNAGCNGGLMDNAFAYVIKNNGLDTEASYAYTGKDGTCKYSPKSRGATISSFVDIASGSEDDLMAAAGSVGPISVAIDASQLSFQFYSSGVYRSLLCSSSNLDHGVLVVGYGNKKGPFFWDGDYWIVKNSWGSSWGQDGYIWMARNHSNMCGIATEASYPVV